MFISKQNQIPIHSECTTSESSYSKNFFRHVHAKLSTRNNESYKQFLILMSSHVESHHILFSSCISHNVISNHRTLKSKRESRCAQKRNQKIKRKLNQMPQNSPTTAPRIAVALLFAAFRPQLFFGE
jgi:tRNA(Ile)-lysidine synthase TilS/MesJ